MKMTHCTLFKAAQSLGLGQVIDERQLKLFLLDDSLGLFSSAPKRRRLLPEASAGVDKVWLRYSLPRLSPAAFKKHFRMSRRTFRTVHDLLRPAIHSLRSAQRRGIEGWDELCREVALDLERDFAQPVKQKAVVSSGAAAIEVAVDAPTGRPWCLSTEEEVAATLLFLSTGASETVTHRQVGVSARTLWRVVKRVCVALCTVGKRAYMGWPVAAEEWAGVADGFFQQSRGRMYGAVGAIDNTHISVRVPLKERAGAIDRDARWTIHVQAVCTADWRILSWRVGDVGARQDSGVLQESNLWAAQEGNTPFIPAGHFLIGDAGFPCRNWLLTPWSQRTSGGLTPDKRAFNEIFCAQRVVIEQLFGIMKSKWQVLCDVRQYAKFHTMKGMKMFSLATAVLHNITVHEGDLVAAALHKKARDIDDPVYAAKKARMHQRWCKFLQAQASSLSPSAAGFGLLARVTEDTLREAGRQK